MISRMSTNIEFPVSIGVQIHKVSMDWQSSGIGLTLKWYWIDIQLVSHWLCSDEIQVTSDWPSSGIGLTLKWYFIDTQVVLD